jgi:hypothetical protein
MREASLMNHHEIRDEFFANREPSVREWQELRAAGVALLALCRPTMVLAGQVVRDRPVGFSFARAGDNDAERAFLIAVEDEDGRLIDIAAWQPMRSWVGLWLGTPGPWVRPGSTIRVSAKKGLSRSGARR